ncbi:MAG: DUF177 domain-containing protein [Candidatus Korobacteraceae bacterium]
MLIRVRELELRKLEFNENLPPGAVGFGPDFRQIGDLHAEGRAELIVEHRGHRQDVEDIRLVGKLSTEIEVLCARCLEPVVHKVARDFDLLYRPQGVDRRGEEVSISEAETEIGYYQGEGLLLEDVLREQVLLSTPVKTVCREECKGLCPTCGGNLNQEQCGCEQRAGDPRWAALGEIKNKLQS